MTSTVLGDFYEQLLALQPVPLEKRRPLGLVPNPPTDQTLTQDGTSLLAKRKADPSENIVGQDTKRSKMTEIVGRADHT